MIEPACDWAVHGMGWCCWQRGRSRSLEKGGDRCCGEEGLEGCIAENCLHSQSRSLNVTHIHKSTSYVG